VKSDDLLGQLNVVTKITWRGEVGQDVDDVLLLRQEVLGESIATLLALLLSSKLDHLDTLLRALFR